MKAPLDPQGIQKRDKLNSDPVLRERQVCRPAIIWNLQSAIPGHWKGGYFYNPDDGTTYRLAMELQSDEGFPVFGETKTLSRISYAIRSLAEPRLQTGVSELERKYTCAQTCQIELQPPAGNNIAAMAEVLGLRFCVVCQAYNGNSKLT